MWKLLKYEFRRARTSLLTVLGVVLASLITGNPYLTAAGTGYVNLSMFFAFAFLFPDTTVLLFFILPVRMKWLAWTAHCSPSTSSRPSAPTTGPV